MPASQIDGLIAAAELGDEARKFMESDVGKFLIGVADQERRKAEEELGETSPENKEAIIKLQRVIWNAKHFRGWIEELIHNGNQALIIYKQQRDGE